MKETNHLKDIQKDEVIVYCYFYNELFHYNDLQDYLIHLMIVLNIHLIEEIYNKHHLIVNM